MQDRLVQDIVVGRGVREASNRIDDRLTALISEHTVGQVVELAQQSVIAHWVGGSAEVAEAETRAGQTMRQWTEVEGLTVAEMAEWCDGILTPREATRLRRLADEDQTGGDQTGNDRAGVADREAGADAGSGGGEPEGRGTAPARGRGVSASTTAG